MSANGMPSDLLRFFQARPLLPHIPYPKRRLHKPYQGVWELLNENPDMFEKVAPPAREPYVDTKMRRERLKLEKLKEYRYELENRIKAFNPREENLDRKTGDPYNTLFIARLNYDTTERTLWKELQVFGNLVGVHIVRDLQGESRGYAFAEFEDEESLKEAYRSFNKKIVDGWKVLADVERGRTVKGWLPKRLGGGLGMVRGREKPPVRGRSGSNNNGNSNNTNHHSGQTSYRHRGAYGYRGPAADRSSGGYGVGGAEGNSSRNYGSFGNRRFKYPRQKGSVPY